MGRTNRGWGRFLRVQYFAIVIFVLWATNILFFQSVPTTGSDGIGEIFDQTMAIGITSSLRAKAQERREAVRSTWLRLVSPKKIKGVFIIGKPDCILNSVPCDETTSQLLTELEEEISTYNDILVVDSTDSYSGLARKTSAFHCWAYDHFPNLEYSMKTDDDIFVRIDTIVQELTAKPKTNFYWGFTWKKAPKVALKSHKNFEANYEPPEYPSFNSGVGNILSADLVEYIANSRNLLRPLSNEDVTIGTWLSTLNVHPSHDTRFQAGEGMCFPDMLTKHPVSPPDMTMFYDRVIARTELCQGVEASACPYGRACTDQQVSWTHGLRCDEHGCEPLPRSVSTSQGEEERASVLLAQTATVCAVPAHTRVKSELRGNLVKNPGFEENNGRDLAFDWEKFYVGYQIDTNPSSARVPFNSDRSRVLLTCEDLTGDKAYGASQNVKIGQTVMSPILITGWVKTTQLIRGGEALEQDTSIYMHITFEDDSRDLQVTLDIEESLSWRFYSKLYYPSKPVKEVSLSILLAKNKGSMWFDNIQILSLENDVALCTASFVSRSIQPLELPSISARYEGDKFIGTPNPLSCRATGPRFILVWTTDEHTFKLQHLRVLESIFYHHSDACVRIFSNTLSRLFFSDLGFYGYDVHVLEYDLEKIARKMPGERWLDGIDKWQEGPHFYAHSSDFLRFLLLYKYGGIYSDFDSILLRPLPFSDFSPDFIGVEWCEAEGLAWCVPLQDSDFAIEKRKSYATQPTNTFSFSIGLMGFSVGNAFVADILRRFETDYSDTRWGCGTVLASLVYRDSNTKHHVRVVPPHAFYPLGYQDIPSYFTRDNKEVWENLKRDSYALHLFGKVSKKEKVVQPSLVHRALTEFSLSNAGFS